MRNSCSRRGGGGGGFESLTFSHFVWTKVFPLKLRETVHYLSKGRGQG